MTPALYDEVLTRLCADDTLDGLVVELVDAACQGDEALAAALAARAGEGASRAPRRPVSPRSAPPGIYLQRLELEGFRGIGPRQVLELAPGPGLTLVVGRNGSGKSSFAEGLETLLTGQSKRWLTRPKDWREGWRNLHKRDGAYIEGTFLVEGSAPITVRRIWPAGADLEQTEVRVRRGSERLEGVEALGWTEPLITCRPFLSYSELGTLLSAPSDLYDELKGILGLEEITAASKRIAEARKPRERRQRDVDARRKALLGQLATVDDARAVRCREAMSGRKHDLDAVEAAVLGDEGGDDDAVSRLRRIVQLEGPRLDLVEAATKALRAAIEALAGLASTSEAQSAQLALLLQAAMAFQAAHGGPCPVCETPLAEDWSARAEARLGEANAVAAQVREATAARALAERDLRRLMTAPPPALAHLEALGLPPTARQVWLRWAEPPADAPPLCEHAEACALELGDALEALRTEVQARLASMESTWRPVARELAAWLAEATAVQAETEVLKALKQAEKWLKGADATLRDARFGPIADRAQEIWSLLRQDSNVDLVGVKLDGTTTRRRVSLNVTVDGEEGVAVGVMSQGELNALALSLFLPRMTLPQSPFHFVVVDDPVQAMDPHKVDGLARVLQDVARTRQVLVLTHDTRLDEAIRRLGIEATVLEVTRRARSVVELRAARDPVEGHFEDAWQCMRHEEEIGPRLAAELVPGFCRLAIEAACMEAIRRRQLGRGELHADVEQRIAEARGAHKLVALAIEDDASRGARVYRYLNNKLGPWATDALKHIKDGAHGGYDGSPQELLDRARRIARALRSLS